MEIKTYKDLKDFLGTLNEEQLGRLAFIAVEDENYHVTEAGFNEEPMVWNEDMDEGYIPVDEYSAEDFDGRPLEHSDNRIFEIGDIVIISAD
jgi:hypothetical protein